MTALVRHCSILNEVLGPVMRGPSSSHSAAPYAIARTCRQLSLSNGETLRAVVVRFDARGSFARVHAAQGADEGFAAGFLGLAVDDPAYLGALKKLASPGAPFLFKIEIGRLSQNDHPNLVEILLTCARNGREPIDRYLAVSTGGGAFQVRKFNGRPVHIDGAAFVVLVEGNGRVPTERIRPRLRGIELRTNSPVLKTSHDLRLFYTRQKLGRTACAQLACLPGVVRVRQAAPAQVLLAGRGPLFNSAKEVLALCVKHTLPEIAVRYESTLSGLPEKEIEALFAQRTRLLLKIAADSLARPAAKNGFRFLQPTSHCILRSMPAKKIIGAPVHRAISAALAIMESSRMRGVVCACPTAGSAGILPGCLHSLRRSGYSAAQLTDAVKVAGLVGAIIGMRSTFAAELAGCMVETGAAAYMAAAGLAHSAGAPAPAVFHAASLCLMNTLGLVCDPVAGEVEVPCHARNIAGVGHAFMSASATLGGFKSFVPFDEIVDSLLAVGQCLPNSLRCTALGGLAATPTALAAAKKK